MIAQTALAKVVEVLRLYGTQRVRGKEMVEAILEVVPVTPAPALLLPLPIVAMQPAIAIVQVIGAQPMQNTQLEFMLPGILEEVIPVSLEVAPGDDLSVLSFVLWRIEIAAEQARTPRRNGEGVVDPSQQIQFERGIQSTHAIPIFLEMVGRGDIDVGQFNFSPGTKQQREERAPGPMLLQLLAVGCGAPLTPEDTLWPIWYEREGKAAGNQYAGRNGSGLSRKCVQDVRKTNQ